MEIEIKARLKDKRAVMDALEKMGCTFSEPKTQDDTVYVKNIGASVEEYFANDVFVRIRIQNGSKVILTAKRPITQNIEELVKREHEVIIDSAEEAKGIIALLGLHEAVRIYKTRQTSAYSGYEICIDDVEGLGGFIELEKMGEETEARAIQEEMRAFLTTLGISPEDKVSKGYDILMLEKTL